MAKYNIIKNGIILSNTSSGTGNKNLTSTELYKLIDGNTTASGVSLLSSDILYLDVDLGNRIKVDGISIYANDLTKLSNINFYYKNYFADTYILCAKEVTSYSYNAQIAEPSAPRYIRCTISGSDLELFEFHILNNDFIVEFGKNGTENNTWLRDTPIGTLGTPQEVDIYNNTDTSDKPASAYACVDYTGNGKDNYVLISNKPNGPFLGFDDNIVLGYKVKDWAGGSFDNTKVESSDNSLRINNTTLSGGTYTSPILSTDEPFKSSYFIVSALTEEGKSSISKDENLYNGTIELRSSDIKPISIDEVYWNVSIGGGYNTCYKYDITADSFSTFYALSDSNSAYFVGASAVDRRTGNMLLYNRCYNSSSTKKPVIVDRDGTVLYDYTYIWEDLDHLEPLYVHFDNNGSFWLFVGYQGYNTSDSYTFRHFVITGAQISYKYIGSNIYAFCAELNGLGIWYTINNTLTKLSSSCAVLHTIALSAPRGVCGTEENGCWVVDDNTVKRYSRDGDLQLTIATSTSLYRIAHDHKSGFYALTSPDVGELWHYDASGTRDMVVTDLFGETHLDAGRNGVVLYSSSLKRARYFDIATKSIIWTKHYLSDIYTGQYEDVSVPVIFSYDEEAETIYAKDYGDKLLPLVNDTTWYDDANLKWMEVPKDGYFLPKNKYHQIRLTLRNYDGVSSPVVKSIAMAPAIQIVDIQPHGSRPLYVRSSVPSDANMSQFNTRLKVWWDVEDN